MKYQEDLQYYKQDIYFYLEERIRYYNELSQTRNGFEDRCKAVKKVLEETLNHIKQNL